MDVLIVEQIRVLVGQLASNQPEFPPACPVVGRLAFN